jgi:hypothetical protein
VGGVSAFLAAAANPRFGVSIWNTLVDTPAAPAAGLFSGPVLDGSTRKPAYFTWLPPL